MSADAGIFADLGLEDVADDPNSFPASTYKGNVYEAKVVNYKDTAKGRALVITYKINDDTSEHNGKTVDEWKQCNSFDDPTKKAWLKRRLISLGVPENRLSQVNPADLVGIPVYFTTKKNGDYTNVTFVKLQDESDAPAGSGGGSIEDLL